MQKAFYMSVLWGLVLMTALSGVVGTGLGGFIGALFRKDSSRTASILLSFAGGVMTAIVCFDLIPQALFQNGANTSPDSTLLWVIVGVLSGVGIVYLLNYWIDKKTNGEVPHIDSQHPRTADTLDELIHSDHYEQHKKTGNSLFFAGIIMACAIALHNIPEGMTIGAAAAISSSAMTGSGLVLAILIGVHNIPEGMAIAVPLISGGMPRVKAVLLTALSGFPTVLGALLGYWLGDIGTIGLCLSLSFASGAMLYVVFGEILPQAYLMYRSKLPAFFIICGMIVGLIIIYC